MKKLFTLLVVVAICNYTWATVLNVPATYATIQAGINASSNGDTVLVQPGTYVENINFIGMDITVASLILTTGDTSYITQTIIDGNANGSVVSIISGETAAAKLIGFTITNGSVISTAGGVYVLNSSPTLSYLKVTGNVALNAAGMRFSNSNSVFTKSIVTNNVATERAGGMALGSGSMQIDSLVVSYNDAQTMFGGGIYMGGNHTITNSFITNNRGDKGGGVYTENSTPTFKNVVFANNYAWLVNNGRGGGIDCYNATVTLTNVTFANNEATNGGALGVFTNTVINTTNTIFWNNQPQEIFLFSGTINPKYCDFKGGGFPGPGVINIDPQFVLPTAGVGYNFNGLNGDWRLQNSSPCINAGNPDTTGLNLPPIDVGGEARIVDDTVDVGAYENQEGLCPKPIANFSIYDSSLTVDFTDLSTGGTSWQWDFGDGTPFEFTQNPVHTYAIPGTYLVCLIVSDTCGIDSLCYNITVNICGPPIADFVFDITGFTVVFTDSSTSPISWWWDFGDGFYSSLENPLHIYGDTGTYTVCLIVTDTCGSDTICYTVTINCVLPQAAFTSVSNNLTINFIDQSTNAITWYWDFGDTFTSTAQNPQHSYLSPGQYTVCLIVTDSCGSDTLCSAITVTCIVPVAGYSHVANNLTVNFFDQSTSANSWYWTFGDASTSTAQNPQHSYASPGTYLVCLIVTDSCSSDTICSSITVTCPTPIGGFNIDSVISFTVFFSDASVGGTSWWWDFGDANFSSQQNPSHTYQDTGWYNVCLVVTDSCGSDTICDSIYVSESVGIEKIANGDNQITIYPNPTNGSFTVQGATGSIVVLDIFGRVVLTTANPEIDMKGYAKGVYFIRVGETVQKLILN